jgi:ADP-ribose pyrophosphatase YjhB (NUDIX family)
MADLNFCPRCAHALEDQMKFGRTRRVCPHCGFIFFRDPKVAAGVLAEREGQVVLVKRAVDPRKGDWALPAGFVEIDETPIEAAERECLEECGLIAKVTEVLGVFHGRDNPNSPVILIVYWAQITGGELKADDDVAEVNWFKPDEIPENLAFESTQVALEKWRAKLNEAS